MRIVAIADLHGKLSGLRRMAPDLREADLVLLAGDITQFGGAEECARVVAEILRHSPRVLGVPGNCDRCGVLERLQSEGQSIHCRREVVGGVAFLGAGMSLPCPGATPGETTEDGLGEFLGRAAEGLEDSVPKVVLVHQPPYGTRADLSSGGAHVGSRAIREFIESTGPLVVFTGHIHEGRGVDSIGPTRVVNPGPGSAGNYAVADLDPPEVTVELRQA